MPIFLILVAVCAGAARLGANNLETSMTASVSYFLLSAAAGLAMVLRFQAGVRAAPAPKLQH